MRIKNQIITTLCAFLFAFTLQAQKGEKVNGYVTLNNSERIEGMIVVGSITENEVKVIFYPQDQTKKVNYSPDDLIAYGFEATEINDVGKKYKKWRHYERHKVDYPPRPFGPKTVFIEKEVEGELTLYCYYIEVRNNPKQPYRYEYYIKDSEGEITKVSKEKFVTDTKNLFKDYTALTSRIGQKKFDYSHLDRMIRDYNYWTVNGHDRNEYRVALKGN